MSPIIVQLVEYNIKLDNYIDTLKEIDPSWKPKDRINRG